MIPQNVKQNDEQREKIHKKTVVEKQRIFAVVYKLLQKRIPVDGGEQIFYLSHWAALFFKVNFW